MVTICGTIVRGSADGSAFSAISHSVWPGLTTTRTMLERNGTAAPAWLQACAWPRTATQLPPPPPAPPRRSPGSPRPSRASPHRRPSSPRPRPSFPSACLLLANDCSIVSLFYREYVRSNVLTIELIPQGSDTFDIRRTDV